jgi:hypothetical protein
MVVRKHACCATTINWTIRPEHGNHDRRHRLGICAAAARNGITLEAWDALRPVDILVMAVAHWAFRNCPIDKFLSRPAPGGCVVDVKGIVDRMQLEERSIPLWRL